MSIRKDDLVEVISGDDALPGKARKVVRVIRGEGKIVVEGVNRTYKHIKPNKRNPQGGRLAVELPINASNVLLYCPTCRRGVRQGRRFLADGAKERYCKKCGNGLGLMAKPKKKPATTTTTTTTAKQS